MKAAAALGLLLALSACAAGPSRSQAVATNATSTAAGGATRDPAVLDIVGSAWLIRTQGDVAPPATPFLDLWLAKAGIDIDDASLVYATTGDEGGQSLFCRAGPLDAAALQTAATQLSPTDPASVAARYALAHPAYLNDASFALLTERPGRAARSACASAGIKYREFTLGLVHCTAGVCPVVLLLKEDRLAGSAAARRLLGVLAAPDGLLADPVSLAMAGMLPLKAADRARIQAALQALLTEPAA